MASPVPAVSPRVATAPAAAKRKGKGKKSSPRCPESEEELAAAIRSIQGNTSLPRASMRARLHAWQRYISSFEYNYTGRTYFNVRRDAGLQKLTIQAKSIIHTALPIQCIEAVFLAAYLTHEHKDLLRIPLSFKSTVEGHSFRHIVLAVCHNGKWGALGMSRKNTLMHKDLVYKSFSALVNEYRKRYEEIWHELVKVYAGFPFSHDTFCQAKLKWRVLRVRLDCNEWEHVAPVLDKYAKVATSLFEVYRRTGDLPDRKEFSLFSPGDDSDPESPLEPAAVEAMRTPGTPGRRRRRPGTSSSSARPSTSGGAGGGRLKTRPQLDTASRSPSRRRPRPTTSPANPPPSPLATTPPARLPKLSTNSGSHRSGVGSAVQGLSGQTMGQSPRLVTKAEAVTNGTGAGGGTGEGAGSGGGVGAGGVATATDGGASGDAAGSAAKPISPRSRRGGGTSSGSRSRSTSPRLHLLTPLGSDSVGDAGFGESGGQESSLSVSVGGAAAGAAPTTGSTDDGLEASAFLNSGAAPRVHAKGAPSAGEPSHGTRTPPRKGGSVRGRRPATSTGGKAKRKASGSGKKQKKRPGTSSASHRTPGKAKSGKQRKGKT